MNTLISRIRDKIRTFRQYLKISEVESISRRYFIMNSFDGVMTTFGVIMGSFITGVNDPRFIIGAGLGASLAMFLSGFAGTYMAERAERLREYRELEHNLLKNLDNSIHRKALSAASIWAALINGISPAISSIISLSPIIASYFGLIAVELSYLVSVTLILALLFVLGVILGRVSRENIVLTGLKMICVGLVIALISFLIGSLG